MAASSRSRPGCCPKAASRSRSWPRATALTRCAARFQSAIRGLRKSLLLRLLAKQAIEPAKDGRRFLYTARLQRDSYVGAESRRFVHRKFGGRLSPLIVRLADEEALDDADIAEIEALLSRLGS